MPLFKRDIPAPVFDGPPEDPQWVKAAQGKFARLLRVDPEKEGLAGVSGVVVIWHAGVRPRWVFIGYDADLAVYLHSIGRNRAIMDYEINGGLYVTWSLIRAEFQPGVVKYLSGLLKPLVENPALLNIDEDPIPVIAPSHS